MDAWLRYSVAHTYTYQVRSGKIRNVTAEDAGQLLKVCWMAQLSSSYGCMRTQEGWTLLDVRPPFEADKVQQTQCGCILTCAWSQVPVEGAVAVPMFVMDPDTSMSGMLKQATAFGMGGWWLGGGHTIPNPAFMAQVQQQLPNKDQGVIVACQKGLRYVARRNARWHADR